MERMGRPVEFTYEANPGEVWEEGEFWIELSWRADPDGSLGIRQYYESPYRPGEKITLEEYYRWMFENSVPGLPEKAAAEGLDPLGYMRKYGVVEIPREDYDQHEREVTDLDDTEVRDDRGRRHASRSRSTATTCRSPAGRTRSPRPRRRRRTARLSTRRRASSSCTPRRSPTGAGPSRPRRPTSRSHVHHSLIDHEHGEYVLLPTYRLPTMIHSRSGNAKYLNELSHTHPLLVCPEDAERIGLQHRRPRARGDRDRLVRHQGARDRGHPPRRRAPSATTWAAGA